MASVSNSADQDVVIQQDALLDPSVPPTISRIQSSISPPPPIRVQKRITSNPTGHQFAMSDEVAGLLPVTTEMQYERYSRGFTYNREYAGYTIPACTRFFPGPLIPPQWKTYVHPEGMRYFFKKTGQISVLTEARIGDPEQLSAIEHYLSEITSFIHKNDVITYLEGSSPSPRNDFATPTPPTNSKDTPELTREEPKTRYHEETGLLLVLELRASGSCGYYFVDHTHQCLFWLDPFDFTHHVDQVRISHTPWVVGLKIKSHYWYHNELFPHLYQLTQENLDEIEDILTFAISDVATSGSTSTINVPLETLQFMHSMVLGFQLKSPNVQAKSIGGAWVIFRSISTLYVQRFLSLYGENGARLSSAQSIYSSSASTHSWPFGLVSLLMFLVPSDHAKHLKRLFLPQGMNTAHGMKLGGRLAEEWRESVLFATVLLTANVGFLTIQSIDERSKAGYRTPAQRSCDFSIVASMGTIMWGLVLGRGNMEGMATNLFLSDRSDSSSGIEMLAVVFSVPYALLMWSMLAFFFSFCITWYSSGDPVVLALISVACGLVILLIVCGAAIKRKKGWYPRLLPIWIRCRCRHAWGTAVAWLSSRKGRKKKRGAAGGSAV